jgi:hypothetical protein
VIVASALRREQALAVAEGYTVPLIGKGPARANQQQDVARFGRKLRERDLAAVGRVFARVGRRRRDERKSEQRHDGDPPA